MYLAHEFEFNTNTHTSKNRREFDMYIFPHAWYFEHHQACVYPDACLRTDVVSRKAPLLGQGIWWTPSPLPLCPKESVGWQGRHLCIYQAPCLERGGLPDTSPIPKHTYRGKNRSGVILVCKCVTESLWVRRAGVLYFGGHCLGDPHET